MTGDYVHERKYPSVEGVSGESYSPDRLYALGFPPEQMGIFPAGDGYYVAYYDSSENRWEALDFQDPIPAEAVELFATVLEEEVN